MTQGFAWRIEGLMKEWTSSLLFVLITLVLHGNNVKASENIIFRQDSGNIHFVNLSSTGGHLSATTHHRIFFDMVVELLSHYPKDIHLYFQFDHYTVSRQKTRFLVRLADGEPTWFPFSKPLPKTDKKTIQILLEGNYLPIEALLNLIHASYNQYGYLRNSQIRQTYSNYYINLDSGIMAVAPEKVFEMQMSSSNEVRSLLKDEIKINRSLIEGSLNYFYKNGSFEFRRDGEEKPFFTSKTIYEIQGDSNSGLVVFVSDSGFFYFEPGFQKISGPFFLKNLLGGRSHIHNINYDTNATRKISMSYSLYDDNGDAGFRKALFIPDAKSVISDYDELQHQILLEKIQDELSEKQKQKENEDLWVEIFVTFLSLLGALYLGYRIRQSRKSSTS